MTLSLFDQMLYVLACEHTVVLGRLDNRDTWTCEDCGGVTDLRIEPHRSSLISDRRTANQLDAQASKRGETVVRADKC